MREVVRHRCTKRGAPRDKRSLVTLRLCSGYILPFGGALYCALNMSSIMERTILKMLQIIATLKARGLVSAPHSTP